MPAERVGQAAKRFHLGDLRARKNVSPHRNLTSTMGGAEETTWPLIDVAILPSRAISDDELPRRLRSDTPTFNI